MTEQNSAASIILNQGTLSQMCLADLQKYFGTQSIEIVCDQPSPGDPQIYQGTGTLLNVNCQIATLHKADQSLFILCAQPNPDQDWSFGTCFPLMPGSTEYLMPGESEPVNSEDTFLLRFISLQSPLWVYCYSTSQLDTEILEPELIKLNLWRQWSAQEHPALPTENGLYMWGRLANDTPGLKELTKFISISNLSPFLLQARVTFPDSFPVLTLHLPLGVDGCKIGTITLKEAAIELSSPLYFSLNNSQITLKGALDLNDGKEINATIDFPLESNLITATGTYSDTSIPFIAASNLSDLPSLQPREAVTLELEFSKSEKTLDKARFSIDLDNWTLIDNVLTLKELSFTFSVFDPLSSKIVIASITAQAFLGSRSQITLLCAGYYPTNQFYFSFDSNTPLKIADLVADLGAQSDGIPDLNINDLSTEYNLSSQDFLTRVDVAGQWNILEDVALNRLQFKIYGQVTYSCEILAEFTIASVILKLEANYNNEGWQFEGSTGYGQAIPIGHLIEDLGHKFGAVSLPASLEGLTIQNLRIAFNTKTKDFTFTCESKLPIEGKELDIIVTIDLEHKENGSFNNSFSGHITFSNLKFDLIFDQDKTSKTFVATYSEEGSNRLNLARLFEHVSSDATLLSILENIEIDLKDALFAYNKRITGTTTITKVLFGLDIGTNINLSNLPLVGKRLPPEQTVSVDDLQLLITSQDCTSEEIAAFNKLTPEGVTKIPEKPKADNGSSTENSQTSSLPKGLNVAAKMQFGSAAVPLALPVSAAPQPVSSNQPTFPPSSSLATSTSTPNNVTWFELQKSFGPIHFERVGVQYKDAVISFFVDVALSAAGLTLSFEGLSIGSPLSKFEPKYNLQGLGIDYKSGSALEIGGAFLRLGDDFAGTAIIRGEAFTLSAMGAYKELQGSPSLFIYAYLNYPLGGPTFFFVEGLAAGFGYNRHITIPAIEEVRNFPLVEDAISTAPPDPGLRGSVQDASNALEKKLTALQKYVQPRVGEHFLAVGVKFNSFKQIDSFALLIIPFGRSFEIDVLGFSTMTVPSPEEGKTVKPVSQVQMVLKARFAPSEGVLSVQALLTDQSYVFSQDCRLQGGFAFFSWFSGEHAGDFVITLGGYHPSFRVPAHYPQVPRLSFNWQKTPQLLMKGDAYFALTSNVVMAGGHFEALWNGGDLRAWFRLGIDFLIAWKPFHYEASAYIDVGASYTFSFFGRHTITAHIGANVEIWGPEFSGKAHVDLSVISFDINFGDRKTIPPKLSWDEFQQSFLPASDKICSISVGGGLIGTSKEGGTQEHWIINTKEFCLVANTLIPVFEEGNNSEFGIAPMSLTSSEFKSSTLSFMVQRDGVDVTSEFKFDSIKKQFPSALWGNNPNPHDTLNSEVLKAIGGYEIRPKEPPTPGSSSPIARKNLDYDVTPRDLKVEPSSSVESTFTDLPHDQDFYAELKKLAVDQTHRQERNDLLQAFGFESSQTIDFTNILETPQPEPSRVLA